MAWLLILEFGGVWHLSFYSQSLESWLKLRHKSPILTSCYKCFYVLVKWFLCRIESLKMNDCPVPSKHLTISIHDEIFFRQSKKSKWDSSDI